MKRLAVVLLAAGFFGASAYFLLSRRGPAPTPHAPLPELVALAPADFAYLFFADLSALRNSPLFAAPLAQAPLSEQSRDYQEFVRATGFDFSRHLDRALLWVQKFPSGSRTTAIAEGRFERQRIARYALRVSRLERKGEAEIFVVRAQNPAREVSFSFLDEGRILLTDSPRLELPTKHNVPLSLDAVTQERLSRVSGSPIFVAGHLPDLPRDFALAGFRSEQLRRLLASLRWVSLAARPEQERLLVVAEGECDSAMNARQIALLLDGLRVVARAGLADPALRRRLDFSSLFVLEALVRAEEISRDGPRLRLVLRLTPEMLAGASPPPATPPTK